MCWAPHQITRSTSPASTPAEASALRAAARPMKAVVSPGPATGLPFTPNFKAMTSSGMPVAAARSAAVILPFGKPGCESDDAYVHGVLQKK